MDEILNVILKDTYSLTQLKHRLKLLKFSLLKHFFGSESEILSPSSQDLDWLKTLPPDFHQKFNKDNVYQIFSDLDKNIANVPTLTIHVTFEFNDATLAQAGTYARKTFNKPSLLLDTKLDPNVIAGAVLIWKGVLRDYSLKAKIEQQKGEILQEFKKFLR